MTDIYMLLADIYSSGNGAFVQNGGLAERSRSIFTLKPGKDIVNTA